MNILILAIIIIALILFFSTKRNTTGGRRVRSKRSVRIFLICYAGLLVAGAAIADLLPVKKSEVIYAADSADELQRESDGIFQAMIKGHPERVDDRFLQEQWRLAYEGQELVIQSSDQLSGTSIIVDATSTRGAIEGYYYTGKILSGIDVTDRLPHVNIQLRGDTLNVSRSQSQVQLDYSIFSKEFVVRQFKGSNPDRFNSRADQEVNYLYLRVPGNVKVKPGNDETFIEYVE